jgi:uncharacterized membrane protein
MEPEPPPIGEELIFGLFPVYFFYTLAIILSIAIIFYWLIRARVKKDTPIELLQKRYARGEIDAETFRDLKKEIGN